MARTNPITPLYLNGQFLPTKGRATFPVIDPSTGQPAGSAVAGTPDDARAAMEGAARAQPGWEAIGSVARARFLTGAANGMRARASELALRATREMGKVLPESVRETGGAIDNLDYYASQARSLSGEEIAGLPEGESLRLLWLPRGVVVAITPWNFPLATVTRKIGPALLGGNTVVLKPSSATPGCSEEIVRAFHAAGLPKGVLQLVSGAGSVVGPALVQHPSCSTVTLTGSTESGVEVLKLAAHRVAKCLLELGGKAPVLIAADADLDWAARSTVFARFWNSGQACIAAERVLVDERVADQFVRKVTALARALQLGPGTIPGVDLGPLYAATARDRVGSMVEQAIGSGARATTGGAAPKSVALTKGAFYPATVLCDVPDDAGVIQEEIFGPVLPIQSTTDLDDAIARVNRGRYGLASYVFTRDAGMAERAARRLRYGETYVNRAGPESPQGYHTGFRESGLGGEGSRYGILDYQQLKSVYVDWSSPHRGDGYFPYDVPRAGSAGRRRSSP
jgi:acyl-CoA reductase-like NAD-dependent aldehyde dehydrogenase